MINKWQSISPLEDIYIKIKYPWTCSSIAVEERSWETDAVDLAGALPLT